MNGPPTATGTPAVDSAALSRAIAAGDEAAFAAFYAAWFPATLALARATTRRDESYCLDLVQDVMVVVSRRLPALRDERAVRAWMATAVGNAAIDRARNEQSRQRRERSVAAASDSVAGEPWLQLADAERRDWLLARVQELPPGDRALLAARFGDGSSVAAAGVDFGWSADAAHGRLRRVMARLRNLALEWWHGT